jgi:hypothetical protein
VTSRRARGTAAVVAALGVVGAAAAVTPATAAGGGHRRPAVHVITKGLDGPFGLRATKGGRFLVAENVSGQVTRIDRRGGQHVVIDKAPGVAGVTSGRARVYAVLGGPNESGQTPAGDYKPTSVLRTDYHGGHVRVLANLERYELQHNPDGQVQFNDSHVPYDALSNPFSMTRSRFGLLVADGGANDVLRINPRTGHVTTFFVPRTVRDVKACLAPTAQANPGTTGCDPVPTGVTVSRGSVYVSTLGAEVPKAGRVYKLDERTGRVQRVWKRLTAPTGVAVSPSGTVFVSEVLHGAPQGQPGPDFDPATVGRITRIRHGMRDHAQVTMPTGLAYRNGHLYASAWSVASFLGIQHAGQVVRVNPRAFH